MMASDFYSTDFKFGNYYLSDFGGIIINKDGWNIKGGVSIEAKTSDIPTHSGKVLVDWRYTERQIEIPVLLTTDIDIDEFNRWLLNGEQVLMFEDTNRKINAILDNTISIKSYLQNGEYKGRVDLSFTAYDSFFDVLGEQAYKKDNVERNKTIYIRSKGNVDSYPLINICPNGSSAQNIKFRWNDDYYTIKNVTSPIYIDCTEEEVYMIDSNNRPQSIINNFVSNLRYDFPTLVYGKANQFTLIEGNVSHLEIQPNSKII